MKNILLFAASNNPESINGRLISHTAGLFKEHTTNVLHLQDYPLPIYSPVIETEQGIPENILLLKKQLQQHDALVISVAEHNQSVTAAFKNTLDWLSRSDKDYNNLLSGKTILLISTSPAPGGGKNALTHAATFLKIFGANIIGNISLVSFYQNAAFTDENFEIKDNAFSDALTKYVAQLENELHYLTTSLKIAV